jgi:hypothetical protein
MVCCAVASWIGISIAWCYTRIEEARWYMDMTFWLPQTEAALAQAEG